MMNYVSIFLIGMVLLSCNGKNTDRGKVIPLETKIASPEESLKASDYFASIEYVPLETTDSSLIGNKPAIVIDKDRVYVGSSQRPCLVFDLKTGKFIRSIGLIDKGPMGYKSSNEFWINPENGVIYFPGWKKELIKYSVNGEFLGTQKIPDCAGDAASLSYLDQNTLVAHCESMMGRVADRLVYFNDKGEVLKNFAGIPRSDTMDISNISNISILTASKMGLSKGGVILLKRGDINQERLLMTNQPVFGHWNGKTWYKESYSDTVFNLSGQGIEPGWVLDMGKYKLGIEERDNREARKDKGNINQVMESDRFLMFSYFFFPEGEAMAYRGVFDKETGEVRTAPYGSGFVDDLNGFITVNPVLENWNNNLVTFLQPLKILDWFEEHPEESGDLKPEILKLKELKEDDNPVLVVIRLK